MLLIWSFVIAFVSTVTYAVAANPLFKIMTNNQEVIATAQEYLPWLLIVPILSCVAFILDGIFIGATASREIRDTMILSALSFFVTYYLFAESYAMHALFAAYMMHLAVRTAVMALQMKRAVILKAAL